jgi:5-methylcytosine-specific restriction protein B
MTNPEFPKGQYRSRDKVRALAATDLRVAPSPEAPPEVQESESDVRPVDVAELIADDDPILQQVQTLRDDGYGGVILRGPPGTSKSWYAQAIAARLVEGDESRIRSVQFHPSYQYEDFVEGYVPDDKGGSFKLQDKHLLVISDVAQTHPDKVCVLVVDELSRADPARVFGEALTYIEQSKRGVEFSLASGRPFAIPGNLFLLGTMNEYDRGVEQVDAALERRLGFVPMDPDPELLRAILQKNAVRAAAVALIVQFFQWLLHHSNPYCHIGHAYFSTVRDGGSLRRLWDHQLRYVFQRAFSLDQQQGLSDVKTRWDTLVTSVLASEAAVTPDAAAPAAADAPPVPTDTPTP